MEYSQGVLTGSVAVVTGGMSGIGRAVVADLSAKGARVAILDLGAGYDTGNADSNIQSFQGDVTDLASVKAAFAAIRESLGAPDILVNSAGINEFRDALATDPVHWRSILAVNLEGTWNCCYNVMSDMVRRRRGAIVNIGSSAALLAIPHASAYVTAKHGIVGLTKALAVDLGPHNVRVNCICPGSVMTPLLEQSVSENFRLRMTERTPLRRLGTPEDIANAVGFLCSPAAAWISGVALPVDGGMVACSRASHWT